MIRTSIFFLMLLMSGVAGAHHSVSAFYDSDTASELAGTITSVDWINPHVRFTLETLAANDEREIWVLESGSVNMLERHGVGRENLAVGNFVTVVGHLSRHGLKEMIAGYISVPSGENIVLWSGLFGGLEAIEPDSGVQTQTSMVSGPQGIFRIWTQSQTYSRDATDTSAGMLLPYTSTALAARERYNPLTDDTALRCIPQGMPGIMDNPFPMEIAEQGGDIVIRMEEWDVVRTVHMSDGPAPDNQLASPLGYSLGRWEEDTLVVTTNRVNWPFFDDVGTPQSQDIQIVEQFLLSAEEHRLHYTITVADAATFTEPVSLSGYWVWVPDEEIKPYNCTL